MYDCKSPNQCAFAQEMGFTVINIMTADGQFFDLLLKTYTRTSTYIFLYAMFFMKLFLTREP